MPIFLTIGFPIHFANRARSTPHGIGHKMSTVLSREVIYVVHISSTIVCFEHTGQERTDRQVTQGNLTSEVLIENSVIVIVKMFLILLCFVYVLCNNSNWHDMFPIK